MTEKKMITMTIRDSNGESAVFKSVENDIRKLQDILKQNGANVEEDGTYYVENLNYLLKKIFK